jgi:hypothetical protein
MKHPLLELAFFAVYAMMLLTHFITVVVGACVYGYAGSVLMVLLYGACMLAFSPIALHSPSVGWTHWTRDRCCGLPAGAFLAAAGVGWVVCFGVNMAILSSIPHVSLFFILAYGLSAIGVIGAVAVYAILFLWCIA